MSRPIHKILQTNAEGKKVCNVRFHSGAADSYRTCLKVIACLRCDICMCMQVDNLWKSTYVTAWENKLEYNYPTFFCCCLVDRVGVIYYDRDILSKTDRASCCKPCCTHMSVCPTCFDMCGEALVLYGANVCSTNLAAVPGIACTCCRCWTMLTNLDDVTQLSQAINTAVSDSKAAFERVAQAPGTAVVQ